MKKSGFEYSQPYITNTEFVINKNFENNLDKFDVDMCININKYSDFKPDGTCMEAKVGLKVEVGKKDDKKYPFYCRVEMETKFKWSDDLDKGETADFMSQNAPALLLGYIRPVIVYLTASSPYPPFNIPLINFVDNNA